jgi:hypothetical protein
MSIIPLIINGPNRESNLQPLCTTPCHSAKTELDVKLKSRVASIEKKHIGVPPTRSRMKGAGFRKPQPQRTASRPIQKWGF